MQFITVKLNKNIKLMINPIARLFFLDEFLEMIKRKLMRHHDIKSEYTLFLNHSMVNVILLIIYVFIGRVQSE